MDERKRTIKIKFSGFWKGFKETDNFIVRILSQKFQIELSEEPEYLFYSVFNDDFIKYDCVRIFITGENICPDFQMCDYAIGFEWLEFGDRYLRCPFYYFIEDYQTDVEAARRKHLNYEEIMPEKKYFCSFVYSNDDSDEMRTKIFQALSDYKKVNAGGRIFNSYGGKRVESKRDFELKHKFSIACENSRHSGYTTEKLLQAFAASTIPIYWGNPEVEKDFNKDAFINVSDFSNLTELVEYIKKVDQNEEYYEKYIKQPAFLENTNVEQIQLRVEEFLIHICEQPLEEAYRRNRMFWGKAYQRRYWVYKRSYGFVNKLGKLLGKNLVRKIEGRLYEG